MVENYPQGGVTNTPRAEFTKPRNVWRDGYRGVGSYDQLNGFLALCVVPIEVMFRRNFGRRWLTFNNFFAGLMVLLVYTGLEWLFIWVCGTPAFAYLCGFIHGFLHLNSHNLFYHPGRKTMPLFLAFYLLRSTYHFFRIFWSFRNYKAEHTFNDGISIFEPLGYYLIRIINFLAVPFIRFGMLFLPRSERRSRKPPPLLNNISAFTDKVVEPLVLLAVAFLFHGVTFVWLLISAWVIYKHATTKRTIRRNRIYDLYDATVEAGDMKTYYYKQEAAKNGTQYTQETEITIKQKQVVTNETKSQPYSELSDIFDKFKKSESGT